MPASTYAFVTGLLLFFLSSRLSVIGYPLFFAPYLVIAMYRFSLFKVLLRGILCGVILDSLSSHPYFGLLPLTITLTLGLLYTQKYNFFEDKLSTLPLMCGIFSFLYTLISTTAFTFFGGKPNLNMQWVMTDLFGMALLDALFALLFFSLPFHLTKTLGKMLLRRGHR